MQPDALLDLLLANRGITETSDREAFLLPSYEAHLHDPFLMKGMDCAVERIYKAIRENEKIIVYSDYDCDGIPGGVILHDFFTKLGYANFENYIPDRSDEGYGLHEDAVSGFIEAGAKLLITIDLGISAHEAVSFAQTHGIDVIITDHHLPHETLPDAYAILNPKQEGDTYPFDMLCGAGVAFKLVQGFIKKYGSEFGISVGWEKWLLDMAGLATLSDMVPLVGENRALAYYGLMVLKKSPRPGLAKLFAKLNIDQRSLSEDDVTFMITPRLNAASRMDSPRRAFELLSATDAAVAGALAEHLSAINDERKLAVAAIMREVKKNFEKRELADVIVVGNPSWRTGILGLVAGKLTDEYKRPAFVWGMEATDIIRGSCRSDGSVNVVELMTGASGSFLNFGGHELAGGFSVAQDKIHFLESELVKSYETARREHAGAGAVVDAVLTVAEVSSAHWKAINQLAPFGLGNPKPLFLFENVVIKSVKLFGKEKNHLELVIEQNGREAKAIAFFKTTDSYTTELVPSSRINLSASFECSYWRGRPELRLRIVDID